MIRKTSKDIQREIHEALRWEPILQEEDIMAVVRDNAVTLTGTVDSYAKKIAAEKAIQKVEGISSVIDNIKVALPSESTRRDEEIERAVKDSIRWNTNIDEQQIQVSVKDGWVTLEGMVEWEFQKSKARNLAADLTGVTGVANLIKVRTKRATPESVKERIISTLKRNYILNGNNIEVEVNKNTVVLKGEVRSLRERNEAEESAWSVPGIEEVINQLEVTHPEVFA